MKLKSITFLMALLLSANALWAQGTDSLINVVYGKAKTWKDTEQTLTMDVFFPARSTGRKYPLVLLMHGGSFLNGSKEAMKSHCKILADSGFIAVSINYRKGWNRASTPLACDADIEQFTAAAYRAVQDAHTALQFLMSKQKEYAINTNWIFAGGSSAGGVIALNLAYLDQANADKLMPDASKKLGALTLAESRSTYKIKGICNMWGALPDSTLITKNNAIPTIFYHGTADFTVPYNVGRFGSICPAYPLTFGSACLYRQTVAAGKAAILNLSPNGTHGPKEFNSKVTMSNTACFFKRIINGTASGAVTYTSAIIGCR